jgi:hypothetical protein
MNLVSELFSERKYYRDFHHKIFTLFLGIYLSFLIGQSVGYSKLSCAPDDLIYLLILIIVLVIPIYTTYIFLRYHLVIAGLNRAIEFTLKAKTDKETEKRAKAWHIGVYPRVKKSTIFKGQGHPYFIITMWLLVLINGVLLVSHL